MGSQWDFDPDSYLDLVRCEMPSYDLWQERLAVATAAVAARRILDLGSGTGVTARSVLERHPGAVLVGIDASPTMLRHARDVSPRATFRVQRLEQPLPDGPFDLVVSAFAIHHLDGAGKKDLFRRVAAVLRPGGRFAFADVVVPRGEVEHPVPLEVGVDLPDRLEDLTRWLRAAELRPTVVAAEDDLALVVADAPDPAVSG